MLIRTVTDVITTNSAGQVVESVPVREVAGPVQNSAGDWIDPIEVEEAAGGQPVRFLADTVTENSVGDPVDVVPVIGGWTPLLLFDAHEATGFFIPSFSPSRLFQDSAATTPVTAEDDPIGAVVDGGPDGVSIVQATGASRGRYWHTNDRDGWRGNGSAYNLLTNAIPGTVVTMAVAMEANAASDTAMGCSDAPNGRCIIGTDGSGLLAAGIGAQTTSTIKGGSDIRGVPGVGIVRANGTQVTLWWKPFGGALVQVYQAAQSGAMSVAVPLRIGARNTNGNAAEFFDGDIYGAFLIRAALDNSEVSLLAGYF